MPLQGSFSTALTLKKILFLSPESEKPNGGILRLFRHARILRECGFDTYVVLKNPSWRPSWDATDVRALSYAQALELRGEAVTVVPEIWAGRLSASGARARRPAGLNFIKAWARDRFDRRVSQWLSGAGRVVVYNLNAYLTFSEIEVGLDPYRDPRVVAAVCLSDDSREYLELAFPGVKVKRCAVGIDPAQFYYDRLLKKDQIVFLARKNAEDAHQVHSVLRLRNNLRGFVLRGVGDVSKEEFARLLRESKLFISFGAPEGFGMPAAEAFACGTHVIGYHGEAGREFFDPEFSQTIARGEIRQFCLAIESAIPALQGERWPHDAAERASRKMLREHSLEKEREVLADIWNSILKSS